MGRCDACGEWNSVVEEIASTAPIGGKASGSAGRGRPIEMSSLTDKGEPVPRRKTGIEEFDRVTGGGLVRGSAILIGGDPGIGKSTLLLQVAAQLAKNTRCTYITGEEAVRLSKATIFQLRSPVIGLRLYMPSSVFVQMSWSFPSASV